MYTMNKVVRKLISKTDLRIFLKWSITSNFSTVSSYGKLKNCFYNIYYITYMYVYIYIYTYHTFCRCSSC